MVFQKYLCSVWHNTALARRIYGRRLQIPLTTNQSLGYTFCDQIKILISFVNQEQQSSYIYIIVE